MSNENFPCSSLLRDRVRACWIGKSIGGTLGLPAEGRMERLNFSFYDPIPTIAPPNDDLELQLVWLHMVEQGGAELSQQDFAQAWIDHIHYMWDEYGRCRWNLRRGVPIGQVGTFENPFVSGMGSPIRSEIWACIFPGDADSAAHYAALDASLDHGLEGISGEVFLAVAQCLLLSGSPLDEAITRAMPYLPTHSETGRAIAMVLRHHASEMTEWHCREQILSQYGSENFTHTPLNLALTVWALLYGRSDFEKSILLAVNGGYDTDCTAATVGATLGLILGTQGIPARWQDPIGEGVFVGPGIAGIDAPRTLTELTDRTLALTGKLKSKKWSPYAGTSGFQSPEPLTSLPGTITILPNGVETAVPWANGELPREIKLAGGGSWTWDQELDEPREVICLARKGARLFIDEKLIIECPGGLPYVPATHRSATGSRVSVNPGPGKHIVRLELNSRDSTEEASVLLAYPNLHIAPWTAQELPFPAQLPAA